MGFLSSVLGKGKKNGSKQQKAFKKADMGDNMQFYFNDELKKYVERGKEEEAAAASAPPPPPPRWTKPSGDRSTPVRTAKPASSGPHARYAALPGLEQTKPSASPGSLAPSLSRPSSAARSANVKTFVPNIAAARAAAEEEQKANMNSDAKGTDAPAGPPAAEQGGSGSGIPSRVGAYTVPGSSQSLSDPGHLQPPASGPFASSPAWATANGIGGVNDSALSSHLLQSNDESAITSPEQQAGFGSFIHGQNSPVDVTSGSLAHVTNGDSVALQPAHKDPEPQSPPVVLNGSHTNGHAQTPAAADGSAYPGVLPGAPPPTYAPAADSSDSAAIAPAAMPVDAAQDHAGEPAGCAAAMGCDAGGAYPAEQSAALYDEHAMHNYEHEHAAAPTAKEGYSGMEAAAVPQYAAAPAESTIPSPWVSFWYSDWPDTLWAAVYEHSPELFYYHYQMKTQAEGWGDEKWEEYRQQYPEHCEHIEYFNVEWGVRGTPMSPMPREGEPLVGGGIATAEWLAETVAAIEAAQEGGADDSAAAVEAADGTGAYAYEAYAGDGAAADEGAVASVGAGADQGVSAEAMGGFEDSAMPAAKLAVEALSEEVTLMQPGSAGQGAGGFGAPATPRLLSADALIAADTLPVAGYGQREGDGGAHVALMVADYGEGCEGASGAHVGAHVSAEEAGYFPGSATASPSRRILSLEDLDYVPDMQQVQELIARYAVPIRPESCAGSDDDRLYRAQPDDERSPNGKHQAIGQASGVWSANGKRAVISRQSSSSSGMDGTDDDDDDGGPDPGQDAEDVEDGFGDMGSMLAVASPSSCHRHEEEARVATGALGNAVAAADSAAAMRHLEAALETRQAAVEAAPSVDASCTNSVHLSDGQSEAPSSMYVHAPSEAVMEEADGASNAAGGVIELPNIPEGSSDLEDITVLPPMHGDVPSTTRPEINITDLERRGMRVGAHSASCAAEAASTQAASDKGSEDDGGAGGHSGSGGARPTAPSMPGSSSGLGCSSGAAGARDAMRLATGSAPGVPGDGAARRILEELGRMHALLHAAGASGEIPNDISSLFGALQQHMEDVAGSMRGHKTLASQLEAPADAPSTATQAAMQAEASQQQQGTPGLLATPSRSEAVLVTPIHTPGILSNMSTPEPNKLTGGHKHDTAGVESLPMNFQAAANPLYAQTASPATSGSHPPLAGVPSPEAPPDPDAAPNAAAAAVVASLQAELAAMAAEAEGLRKALEGSATENAELRQRLMEAEAREEEAAARLQAALSARDAVQAELQEAQQAGGELRARIVETQAENASLQDAIAAAQKAVEEAKAAAAEQAAAAAAAAAEGAAAVEQQATVHAAVLQRQLEEAETAVQEQTLTLATAHAQAMAAADAERAEAEEARAAHAVAAAALQAAETAAGALQGEVAAAEAEAAAAVAAAEAKVAEAADVAAALERSEAERSAAAAELLESRHAMEALQQEQAAIQESLRAAAEAESAAAAGQKAAEAEREILRQCADGAQASAAAVQAQLATAEQAATVLRQELFAAQQEGAALSQQLEEAQAALCNAQAEVAAAAQRCAEAEAAVAELEADLDLSVMAMGMETDKVTALEEYVAELGGDAAPLLERIEEEHTAAQEASVVASEAGSGAAIPDGDGDIDGDGGAAASDAGDGGGAVDEGPAVCDSGVASGAMNAAAPAESAVAGAGPPAAVHVASWAGNEMGAEDVWHTEGEPQAEDTWQAESVLQSEDVAQMQGVPQADEGPWFGASAEGNGVEDAAGGEDAWGGWGSWDKGVDGPGFGAGESAVAARLADPTPVTAAPNFFGNQEADGWAPPEDGAAIEAISFHTAVEQTAGEQMAMPPPAGGASIFNNIATDQDGWGAWDAEDDPVQDGPASIGAVTLPAAAVAAPAPQAVMPSGGTGFFDEAEAAYIGGPAVTEGGCFATELATDAGEHGAVDGTAAAAGGAIATAATPAQVPAWDAAPSGGGPAAVAAPAAAYGVAMRREDDAGQHTGGFFDSWDEGSGNAALPPHGVEGADAGADAWLGAGQGGGAGAGASQGAYAAPGTAANGDGYTQAHIDGGDTGGWGNDGGWGEAQDGWQQGGWGDSAWGDQGDASMGQPGAGWGGWDGQEVTPAEPPGDSGAGRFFV